MTSPAPSGGPSRRRVAGLALVGVGVIAAIIGLASLALDGGGDGQTAAPPPGGDTATTAPPPPGEAGPTTGAPPATSDPVAVPTFPTSAIAAPPPVTQAPAPAPAPEQGGSGSGGGTDASGGSGGSGGAASGVSRGPVRVYNNSTITGLAASAAEDLRNAGWEVGEVANYPFGIIRTTTVYYRPGTAEKGTAEALGREFDMRVSERFEGLEDASPGVIVIVTNDYKNL